MGYFCLILCGFRPVFFGAKFKLRPFCESTLWFLQRLCFSSTIYSCHYFFFIGYRVSRYQTDKEGNFLNAAACPKLSRPGMMVFLKKMEVSRVSWEPFKSLCDNENLCWRFSCFNIASIIRKNGKNAPLCRRKLSYLSQDHTIKQ